MSENLTRFESERQRQDRRPAKHIKRAKQVERNRVEWCNRMYHAALAACAITTADNEVPF